MVHSPANENKLPDFISREPGFEDTTDVQEEPRLQPWRGHLAVSQQLPHDCKKLWVPASIVQEAQESDEEC